MKSLREGLAYLLLGQPALSSLVARALATKGDQPQYLESRYQLGINALDLTDPEFLYLRRSPTFVASINQAAVAAQFPIIALQNNLAGSRASLCVIEEITIANTAAAAAANGAVFGVTFGGAGGVGAGAVSGVCQDDRFGGVNLQQSRWTIAAGSNAASPMAIGAGYLVQLPGNTSQTFRGPWILSNKDNGVFSAQLVIAGTNVNTALAATIRWHERELLASEL